MSSPRVVFPIVNRHFCRRSPTHIYQCSRKYVFSTVKSYLSRNVEPPKAKYCPGIPTRFHGKKRVDGFSWMQNSQDPDLLPYIQAENAYSKQFMKRHRFLQRAVLQEMKSRLQVQKTLPPLCTVAHGYEYYSRTSHFGLIYLRKKIGSDKEQELLNVGLLKSLNMTIRKVLLSPDHNVFAYNTEQEGMEYGDLHLKDLAGEREFEVLHDVFNFTWANKETIYYTVPNEQLRPYRVYAHRLGTDQDNDILIYEETNDSVFVDVTTTKDLKYITINSNSLSSSEVRIIDASHTLNNGSTPVVRLVEPRKPGLEYYVDHHEDTFYILTNADGATDFKLMKAQDEQIAKQHWKDVVKMAPTEKIEDVDIFQNYIVIYGRREGLPMILCHDLHRRETFNVKLPEDFCVVHPGTNSAFNTDIFRFTITSPFAHESTYDYDMSSRKLLPVRVQPIHRFERSKYKCTRIYAKSTDGMSIPITLLHRKDIQLHGRNPVLMRSYGAYGISTDPDFRIEHFPLLERGWIIALPHVRGGSELGKDWYREGKLENKMNSFKDFICAAEHLVQNKFTSPEYLSAMGTSAGGLLVGAMINMRPDLFKALVLRVPFVDPLSAMLDPDLPLTQMEYPEWGNPVEDPKAYDLISSYSPYENIGAKYNFTPSLYITAGLKDQRVAYWQPLKLVARIRQTLPSTSVLLKVDEERGHFGAVSEQEVRLSEAAEQVAFLISQIQRL